MPSLQEAFAYVYNSESHRFATLPPTTNKRSALVSFPWRDRSKQSLDCNITSESVSLKKSKQFCDYCNWPYHIRATCWQLHGRPIGGHGSRSGQSRGRGGHSHGGNPEAHYTTTLDSTAPGSIDQALLIGLYLLPPRWRRLSVP